MVIVINSVIGGFGWADLVWLATSTVRLRVSDYSKLSDYTVWSYSTEWLVKNNAANAPITFEEIVMIMIRIKRLYCNTSETTYLLIKLKMVLYNGLLSECVTNATTSLLTLVLQ